MTVKSADALVAVANGQINYVERGGRDGKSGNLTKFGKAYGLDGYAWCSIFVWWCFYQLGIDVRHDVTGAYASADAAMRGFTKHGWKIAKAPRKGDVVFFHFPGEHAGANHTGIVVGSDKNGVYTIEGNTSDGPTGSQVNGGGVYRRYRPYSLIIGYGRYPFPVQTVVRPATGPKPIAHPTKSYPTLQHGVTSPAVKRLQSLLHLKVDGVFGDKTEAAVKGYQRTHGLKPDGIAGPATLAKLGY